MWGVHRNVPLHRLDPWFWWEDRLVSDEPRRCGGYIETYPLIAWIFNISKHFIIMESVTMLKKRKLLAGARPGENKIKLDLQLERRTTARYIAHSACSQPGEFTS